MDVGGWEDHVHVVRRKFPGPRFSKIELRIAIDGNAYAELVVHTKDSLDCEVCGVLVGDICEDDEGLFVHVRAVIRGDSTRRGETHVTFTQETWNAIHKSLEEDYPNMYILGWYHSHPGFGVRFSDMDLFIQENFFSSPTQFALLTDPLSGKDAICANASSGLIYLDRFFVEGRERKCELQNRDELPEEEANLKIDKRIAEIETRISQLMSTVDDLRISLSRFILISFFIVCLFGMGIVVYSIYSRMTSENRPPELRQYVQVPVLLDDQVVILGVGVVDWKIPEKAKAYYLPPLPTPEEEASANQAASGAENN